MYFLLMALLCFHTIKYIAQYLAYESSFVIVNSKEIKITM